MKKLLPVLVIALAASGCAQILSAGAAVVNGERISQERVDGEVKTQLSGQQAGAENAAQIARQVLGQLIQQRLLLQEAARRHLKAKPADVQQQYDRIHGQFQDEAEFRSRLKEFGLTPATLRDRIRESLIIGSLGTKIAGPVTDAQLREVYKNEESQFRQVRFRHILFTVDAKHTDVAQHNAAIETRKKILAGSDFAKLATQLTDDTGSKSRGGLYDFQPLAQLDPAFGDAAWAGKVGVVTQPVRSQFGWHLILVLAKRVQPFAEVSEQLRTRLEQSAGQTAQNAFLRNVIQKANVIVNPRYGDWDAQTASIVPHSLFKPAENSVDENAPQGFSDAQLPLPGAITQPGG